MLQEINSITLSDSLHLRPQNSNMHIDNSLDRYVEGSFLH